MILKAYSKLNWTLDVCFKRRDGYHELDMLMQSVDIYDTVILELAGSDITVEADIPLPERNTAFMAAKQYMTKAGIQKGVKITLSKSIPEQAGLGGGSSDAAAVLYGLNRILNKFTEKQLANLALKIGSDVPFCLTGGTARAAGRGEILLPVKLPEGFKPSLVIVKPEGSISTAGLFGSLILPTQKIHTDQAQRMLQSGDQQGLAHYLGNALEPEAIKYAPDIEKIKRELMHAGALGSSMTGSGSAVFGLFQDENKARSALKYFSDYPFVRMCTVVPYGVEVVEDTYI